MRGALGLCVLSGLSALMLSACVGAPESGDDGAGLDNGVPSEELAPTGRDNGTYDYLLASSDQATPDGNAQAPGGNLGAATITYHSGKPVMTGTVHTYLIWYGNWAGNTATTIIPDFMSHIGGSPYYNINTTYYQTISKKTTHITNSVTLAGQTTDSYSLGSALSDANIKTIVTNAISSGKLPKDTNGVYFVLTSADVNETSGFCTQYCGWHTHGTISGSDIKYSVVGNPDRCINSCAAQSTGPNGNAGADGMVSILAHELEETHTDPDLNAWYDSQGYENGDKCAWTFGTQSTASNGSKYNVTLNGKQYLIQQNWVVPTKKCAISY